MKKAGKRLHVTADDSGCWRKNSCSEQIGGNVHIDTGIGSAQDVLVGPKVERDGDEHKNR
jgi:hypothetical protein